MSYRATPNKTNKSVKKLPVCWLNGAHKSEEQSNKIDKNKLFSSKQQEALL